MKFKAIAIDIDGTITCMDRSLDLDAVKALRDLQIPVILATGNILCYARAASILIGLNGLVISENGGIISKEQDSPPIISDLVDDVYTAYNILSQQLNITKLDSEYRKTEIVLRNDFDIIKAQNILKHHDLNVEIIDTHFAVHIKSKYVNKGTGLKRAAEILNIFPHEFIAIGDSMNDFEMLKIAGFSISVNNADTELKQISDFVSTNKYGAGVVEGINYLKDKNLI